MVPKLKRCVWYRVGDELAVMLQPYQVVTLADPTRQVEELLRLLREGSRPLDMLRSTLSEEFSDVSSSEIVEALESLDSLGFLENSTSETPPSWKSGRFDSNLEFFGWFSTLRLDREELQRRIVDSHVLVLGVGGLGSTTVMNLAGLGVGRLTLLDFDQVEPKNFARQFLYRANDIGHSKVDRAAAWVREFDPNIRVRAEERRIDGPSDVADLLDGVDLVVRAVDKPSGIIAQWVNEACVTARVVHIGGGMAGTRLSYYSVNPGISACCNCDALAVQESEGQADCGYSPTRMRELLALANPGIGPFASLLGSLVAVEALRYLTRFAPPITAGAPHMIDIADGAQPVVTRWAKRKDCTICLRVATAELVR